MRLLYTLGCTLFSIWCPPKDGYDKLSASNDGQSIKSSIEKSDGYGYGYRYSAKSSHDKFDGYSVQPEDDKFHSYVKPIPEKIESPYKPGQGNVESPTNHAHGKPEKYPLIPQKNQKANPLHFIFPKSGNVFLVGKAITATWTGLKKAKSYYIKAKRLPGVASDTDRRKITWKKTKKTSQSISFPVPGKFEVQVVAIMGKFWGKIYSDPIKVHINSIILFLPQILSPQTGSSYTFGNPIVFEIKEQINLQYYEVYLEPEINTMKPYRFKSPISTILIEKVIQPGSYRVYARTGLDKHTVGSLVLTPIRITVHPMTPPAILWPSPNSTLCTSYKLHYVDIIFIIDRQTNGQGRFRLPPDTLAGSYKIKGVTEFKSKYSPWSIAIRFDVIDPPKITNPKNNEDLEYPIAEIRFEWTKPQIHSARYYILEIGETFPPLKIYKFTTPMTSHTVRTLQRKGKHWARVNAVGLISKSSPIIHFQVAAPPTGWDVTKDVANFKFSPVSVEWMQSKCSQLRLNFARPHHRSSKSIIKSITDEPPDTMVPMKNDRNSLFQALSYVITGTPNNYVEIKNILRNHIMHNIEWYQGMIGSMEKLRKHLDSMMQDGFLGTDMELIAASVILKTPIYIYAKGSHSYIWSEIGHWLPPDIVPKDWEEAIYVVHVNGNRYQPIYDWGPWD